MIKTNSFTAIALSAVHKNKYTSKVLAGIAESIAAPLCSLFADKVNILKRISTHCGQVTREEDLHFPVKVGTCLYSSMFPV